MTALVNIKVEKKRINDLAKEILNFEGVQEVLTVTGHYDIIVIIRATCHEEVSKIVTENILELDNILETNTVIAFQSYKNDIGDLR